MKVITVGGRGGGGVSVTLIVKNDTSGTRLCNGTHLSQSRINRRPHIPDIS